MACDGVPGSDRLRERRERKRVTPADEAPGAADAYGPALGHPSADPSRHWPELLADALSCEARPGFVELLHQVSGCNAGLVDVAGWLSDEMNMGRVRPFAGDGTSTLPPRYEIAPGALPYARRRLDR